MSEAKYTNIAEEINIEISQEDNQELKGRIFDVVLRNQNNEDTKFKLRLDKLLKGSDFINEER